MTAATLALLLLPLGAAPPATATEPPPITVELLEAGRSPRQPLRYDLAVGATWEVATRLWASAKGATEPADPIVVRVRGQVKAAAPGGGWILELDPTVSPPGAAEPTPLPLATVELAPTGRVRSVVQGPPRSPSPLAARVAAVQAIRLHVTTAAVFPDEPVGVGARWRRSWRSPRNGFVTQEVTTFRLVSVDGARLQLALVIEEAADGPQTVKRPAGALASYRRKGTTTVEGGLSTLAFSARGGGEATLVVDQSIERVTRITVVRAETTPGPPAQP